MKSAKILGALIALAFVAMMAPPHQSADAKTCVNVMGKVANGQSFHNSQKCYTPGGCNCTAQKCTTTIYLPGTGYKESKTQYVNAKCDNNLKVILPKAGPAAGCTAVPEAGPASVNNGKSFHGAKCTHSSGCFCSAERCGSGVYVFKNAKCWKAPT